MEKEIKEGLEALGKNLKEFQAENDKKLADLASKGSVDTLLETKLKKLDADWEAKLARLETAMNRAGQKDSTESVSAETKDAFSKLYRKQGLSSAEESLVQEHMVKRYGAEAVKQLSVISNADGGYFVRPEVSDMIGKKLFESSPMRQEASIETISSDSWEELYDNDEVEDGWVGELESREDETDSNQIGKIKIPVHEMKAQPIATQKVLDDAFIDIEAWHAGKVTEKFARTEATAFITGDGINRPKGILSYTAGDGFDKVQQVALGHASTLTADGLLDLQGALFEEFQANAKWFMKRATMTAIRKLKNSENLYLLSLAGGLAEGFPMAVLGKPVRFANDMADVGANALAIAYGDFKAGYKIIDRIGVRVIRDVFTKKGFVKFYTTKRVGGGVVQFQAIKIGKVATSV